jgi:hypothetical protein
MCRTKLAWELELEITCPNSFTKLEHPFPGAESAKVPIARIVRVIDSHARVSAASAQ